MNRSLLGLAATVLLTMTVQSGFAAKPAQVPAIPQSAASANLIARADRALRDYVASTGDIEAFARVVTSDAVVEYALEEPGTYLTVEAAALSAKRSGNFKQAGTGAYFEPVDLSNERFKRGVRSLHDSLRRSIAGPAPGLRTSGSARDAR